MPKTIPQAVQQAERAIHDAIQQLGISCNFQLRNGTAFTVRGTLSGKGESDLTGGLDQDVRMLTVSEQSWRAASPPGRDPEKGDLVVIEGRRHRVMDTTLDAAANVRIRWRLAVKG